MFQGYQVTNLSITETCAIAGLVPHNTAASPTTLLDCGRQLRSTHWDVRGVAALRSVSRTNVQFRYAAFAQQQLWMVAEKQRYAPAATRAR
jgi:hypothetical protein